MFDAHKNFAVGTILTAPSPATSGTSFELLPGEGSLFEENMPVTLSPKSVDTTMATAEIGYITDITGDTLTITRAQEGTVAKSIADGWAVIGSITVKTISDIEDSLGNKADDSSVVHDTGNETVAGIKTFSSSPIVPTPTTSTQAATKGYVDTADALKVAKGELVVNLKDYGAVGDGVTNDTAAFAAAFAAGGTIIIPKPTVAYLVQYFAVPINKHVIGVGMPQINIQRSGATAISIIRTGCIVEGLYLNSIDADLNNNRVGIESATDVVVRNCKIEGFRHVSATPNAWGIYINASSRVRIENCIFENNSQSDITVVDGCSHVAIENCSGSNFVVNIEPNGTSINEDVTIENCRIARLYLLENSFLVHAIKAFTIIACIIDELRYRGANVTFIDTRITTWYTHSSGNRYGAKVTSIGSFGFGENLNSDPFFHRVLQTGDSKTSWVYVYTPDASTLDYKEDATKGRYLAFNPNGLDTTISIAKKIAVDPQTTYAMRALFNTFFPTGSGTSNGFRLRFYDASDVLISSFGDICFDRKDTYDNQETAWDEKTTVFETPALCAYVEITISNATSGSTSAHKLNIARLTVSKLLLDAKNNVRSEVRTVTDDGPSLVAITAIGAGQNQSLVGQVIYSSNPFTTGYEKWICLTSGNPGVWRGITINEHWVSYNTVDQTTDYERLVGSWVSNVFSLRTERGGTGTVVRPIQIGNISSITLAESASPAFRYNRLATTDASAAQVQFSHAGLGASSGVQIFNQNAITVTQTNTAGYTANDTNVTQSSVGSGVKLLHNWRVGGASQASLDSVGQLKAATFIPAFAAKTAAYTALTTDHTLTGDATSAAFQITLPTAVGISGREYVIKKIDASANAVTVGTTSSQTIDGSTTYALATQWKYVRVQSDGANWIIVGNN